MKTIDMTGVRCGKLTVIERDYQERKSKKAYWRCVCDCGNTVVVSGDHLRNGHTQSCGCSHFAESEHPRDLTGLTVFSWNVIKKAESDRTGRTRWLCRCVCGKERVLWDYAIRSGRTKSCGCMQYSAEDAQIELYGHLIGTRTHGMTDTRLYAEWCGMKRRCLNKNEKAYKHYGAKGILICDEWINSFESFAEWSVNNDYSDDLTIDRVDPNGNYEPSNCRWVDKYVQANNKSNNIRIEIDGITHTPSEWERICGVKAGTIRARYWRGVRGRDLISPPRGTQNGR